MTRTPSLWTLVTLAACCLMLMSSPAVYAADDSLSNNSQGETAQPPPEAARPLTLQEAMLTALKQHPSLARAEAQAGAIGARVGQARSGMQPNIFVQGVATNGPLGAPAFGPLNNPGLNGVPPLGLQGMAGDPVKKQFGGGLNLTQTLYDFGRTQHLVEARKETFRAAQEDTGTQKALVLLCRSFRETCPAEEPMRV